MTEHNRDLPQMINPFRQLQSTHLGAQPVIINVLSQIDNDEMMGGSRARAVKNESYIMFSALPEELKMRVKTAIEAIIAGQ